MSSFLLQWSVYDIIFRLADFSMKAYIAVPVTLAMVYRAHTHKSLTPVGIVFAIATAIVHSLHPWSAPYVLLIVFFIAGTRATKIKHDVKTRITLLSTGSHGGEGARTHVQVLANSLAASVLILLHIRQLNMRHGIGDNCWGYGSDPLVVGIVANYAAVAADTFSSELGILSKSKPRLITSLRLRQVPPGTNGGVTLYGLFAGFLGAYIIAVTSAIVLPLCPNNWAAMNAGGMWTPPRTAQWVCAITLWGGLGSILDSFLGGFLQASVVDTRTCKIVEGVGGQKVLYASTPIPDKKVAEEPAKGSRDDGMDANTSTSTGFGLEYSDLKKRADFLMKGSSSTGSNSDQKGMQASRRIVSGRDMLDNNGVNLLMATIMSFGAVVLSSYLWNVPIFRGVF